MHPLETYLKNMRSIHATGEALPETSYYPALCPRPLVTSYVCLALSWSLNS